MLLYHLDIHVSHLDLKLRDWFTSLVLNVFCCVSSGYYDLGAGMFLYIAAGLNTAESATEISLTCEQNRLAFVMFDFLYTSNTPPQQSVH